MSNMTDAICAAIERSWQDERTCSCLAECGRRLDDNAAELTRLRAEVERLKKAVAPLVKIADAYDDNALDDDARKTWGINDEHENTTPPEQIQLYCGRGGRLLLTLADCFAARTSLSTREVRA